MNAHGAISDPLELDDAVARLSISGFAAAPVRESFIHRAPADVPADTGQIARFVAVVTDGMRRALAHHGQSPAFRGLMVASCVLIGLARGEQLLSASQTMVCAVASAVALRIFAPGSRPALDDQSEV